MSSAVTTRELVEIRGLSGLTVSPDGAYAAMRVDWQEVDANRTVLEWRIIRLQDGRTLRTSEAGAPRWNVNGYVAVEAPQWSSDSKWIYFRKLTGEAVQLWRISLDGDRSEQVTNDPSDVQAFQLGAHGGVDYAVGPATRDAIKAAEERESDSGVLLDRTVIRGFPVAHGFPVNGRMATYRLIANAANLGRATLLGDRPLHAFSVDARTGRIRPADADTTERLEQFWAQSSGGFEPIDPTAARKSMSRDGQRTASLTPARADAGGAQDRSGLVLSWREGATPGASCEDPICTNADAINIVGWTAHGESLIFQARTFAQTALVRWDVLTGRLDTIVATPGALGAYDSGTGGVCQLAGSEAICIAASADEPPRVRAFNLDTHAVRTVFDPNPRLTPDRLGEASTITLNDRFGNTTVGRVLLPRGRSEGQRLPLVISNYSCGGFLLGGSGRDVPEHVLVGQGYAAICVDHTYDVVRRAPDFVVSQDNSNLSHLDFFESAVRVLNEQGLIDPDRVSLNGFSGGATAATFAITRSTAFTAAAVTTEGSLDPIVCYVTAPSRTCEQIAQRAGYGPPYDSAEGILRNSPALNAERIATPLLMQLPEVEYVTMLQLYSAMLDYGRAVEMYIFPNAYHYKNQPRQRLAVYERNADWTNFWLRGEESKDPLRAEQNSRWRQLRERQCQLFGGDKGPPAPWYCRAVTAQQ